MTNLSTEQQALKDSINKSALIWGVILGLIVAGIAYWALGGQSSMVQMSAAGGLGLVTLAVIKTWRTNANSAAAKCGSCNAAFSITRTDRTEELKSSENKETRDAQPDYSTKVVTWVEDTVEVTDTYTCAKCNDATTKQYTKTVKRDEVETIEPAPVKDKPKDEGGFFSDAEPKADEAPSDQGGFFSAAQDGGEKKITEDTGGMKSPAKKTAGKDGGSKK